jgi:hypothetical protein
MGTFVQIGATRDGLDPYLHVARNRGMKAILIETPDYINFRKALKRQEFDQTIAVEHPARPGEIIRALEQLSEPPTLLLAGFERYIYSAYEVAKKLQILPWRAGYDFFPPDKAEQRRLIAAAQNAVLQQPGYILWHDGPISEQDLSALTYPVIVKPVDGGGGLGVFLARNFAEVNTALRRLGTITNYDGGKFGGVIIEEYVDGIEYSLQGVVRDTVCHVFTVCKKIILPEAIADEPTLHNFREIGHIAEAGEKASDEIRQFAQACVDTFGYPDGPFHIDMRKTSQGYALIEMGFRLSGFGITMLIQNVGGYDWAEEVFTASLGEHATSSVSDHLAPCIGIFSAATEKEIDQARQLRMQGYNIDVQMFSYPSLQELTVSSLKSDLSRHAGTIGRITVQAATIEEVERILQTCSPEWARPASIPISSLL